MRVARMREEQFTEIELTNILINMQKSKFFRPDFIVALFAVIIGICTMFVYIYQAKIMSKQMHAAAWPYVEANITTSSHLFEINVKNKGVGPAIIKKVGIALDSQKFSDTKSNLDSIAQILTGNRTLLTSYTNLASRVMSPGDNILFLEVKDSTNVMVLLGALQKHKLQLEICYCSVYDECWLLADGKLEPCDSCK
jgi:predicted nucleic acid-binding Zn finger protein